jgi:hypothetical protein
MADFCAIFNGLGPIAWRPQTGRARLSRALPRFSILRFRAGSYEWQAIEKAIGSEEGPRHHGIGPLFTSILR